MGIDSKAERYVAHVNIKSFKELLYPQCFMCISFLLSTFELHSAQNNELHLLTHLYF